MAASYSLPSPAILEIHDTQAAEKWTKFKRAWKNYALATEISKKSEDVQVATLLTVIGEEAREVYSTFTDWTNPGDDNKLGPVLDKFESYCQPRKNVPFERYRFNRRAQETGESYDQYCTALRKLATGCDFGSITQEEIIRDRIVFGIRDSKVRERLLREAKLTLQRTDEICHAAESMVAQLKVVEDSNSLTVSAVGADKTHATDHANPVPTQNKGRECWSCGRRHELHRKELCPAYGKTCNHCHKPNHFAVKCRSRSKGKQVNLLEDEEETFPADISSVALDDNQLVTLKLESGKYLKFQADTGAQCNVLPLSLYKRATKDAKLKQVTPSDTSITAYGGTKLPVVGTALVRVWRGNFRCKLNCKLVDSPHMRPLLGRKACIGMKIVSYLDNDAINPPVTAARKETVYVVNPDPDSVEAIKRKYPTVFAEGVGCLEGKYHIKIDPNIDPVQHTPRRVPIAMREQLKSTLDQLAKQNILAPVTTPTPWISSLVIVPKKDGTLRLCIDPKDLNKAILRENYPLPTIEEVATRLHGAKLFSTLDVRCGFWHVELDEPSSYLTTFNTPFGRYRWKRMPFGISSAPEVFQRRMHELIEGLHGVEVVADDFMVVGYGDDVEQANQSHDTNLDSFLRRCDEKGIHLNAAKAQLRKHQVPFIGHIASGEGLKVDPTKVRAVCEMPPPTDVVAVQRLLGFVQYLSKFLPHLSEITKPLRDLTQKESLWFWGEAQENALNALKTAVTKAPVLRYYSSQEEVTIQCDASQSGLGAALLQNGQPVAYASRALSSAETRYAQIEKELLAILVVSFPVAWT